MSTNPVYAQAMDEIQQLKANGIPAQSLNSAYAAMTAKATDPAIAQQLIQEIQDLFDAAMAMDRSFERIKNDLDAVDAHGYTSTDGKPLEKLKPTWAGYQQRFISLLWSSRDAATDTIVELQSFAKVLLPLIRNPSISMEEKKAELSSFIMRASAKPAPRATSFSKLYADIEVFSKKYGAFFEAQSAQLDEQIKSVKARLAELKKDIEASDKTVKEAIIAIGATAGGAAIGITVVVAAFSAFGAAGPGVLVSLITAASIAIIAATARLVTALQAGGAAREEQIIKKAELDRLNTQLKDLQALKAALDVLDQDLNQTYARLDDFSSMRSMVLQDAQLIQEYLNKNSELDETMTWRIQLMEAIYKALIPGLRFYATTVSQSDLPSVKA